MFCRSSCLLAVPSGLQPRIMPFILNDGAGVRRLRFVLFLRRLLRKRRYGRSLIDDGCRIFGRQRTGVCSRLFHCRACRVRQYLRRFLLFRLRNQQSGLFRVCVFVRLQQRFRFRRYIRYSRILRGKEFGRVRLDSLIVEVGCIFCTLV